jgi:quercetin dioxygenase-like cupin family protein
MKVLDASALAAETVSHAGRPATALVHDSADARVVIFRIEPGQQVPVHTSASTVILTIMSGSGVVTGIEGERVVRAGGLVTYDAMEPHGMRAGDEQLVIAAVIAPRPSAH